MKKPTIHDPLDLTEVAVKNNLKKRQVVNGFSELCRLCNVTLGQGGKQRRNAEAKISQYVDFSVIEQEGHRNKSYVINEIYEIPHVHSRRSSGKYRDRLLRALYYDLMNADILGTYGSIITDYDELAEQLGFVNRYYQRLSDYRYKSRRFAPAFDNLVSPINPLLINEFLMVCKSRYKEILKSTLNDFLAKGMIESREEPIQLVFVDNSRRWAEDWEIEIISRVHRKYFPDGKAQFLMKEAERRHRYSSLIKEINDEREAHYNELDEVDFNYIKYYQNKLIIAFDKDKMSTAAARNEIVLLDSGLRKSEKEEVTALFQESLSQLFRRRYLQKIEAGKRLLERLNNGLAFGEASDNPLEPILDDYIDVMDRLLLYTVSTLGANSLNSAIGTH